MKCPVCGRPYQDWKLDCRLFMAVAATSILGTLIILGVTLFALGVAVETIQ